MGFHYTNFVVETNAWWLRRVRPVWMVAAGIGFTWVYYRYYFFGKIQANWLDRESEQTQQELAKLNMGKFGYGYTYQPTLERSMKKKIRDSLGEDYKIFEPHFQEEQIDPRPRYQIIEEENKAVF